MEKIIDISKGVYKETIIRCKDCKYFDGDEWCYEWGENKVREDDFCSYAEREEGADDEQMD